MYKIPIREGRGYGKISKFSLLNRYHNKINITTNFQSEVPDKDIVILAHGFYASSETIPIEKLSINLSKNFNVVTFDFIGRGEGMPTCTECISDLFDVITYFSTQKVATISLVGHSMGAAVCLIIANKVAYIKKVNKLILIGMPYTTTGFFNHYQISQLKPDETKKRAYIKGKYVWIQREFLLDLYRYNLSDELEKLQIPVELIYGEKDKVVKRADINEMYSKIFSIKELIKLKRRKEKVILATAGHLFKGVKNEKALALSVSSFLLKNYAK